MTNGPQGPGTTAAQAALDSARSSSLGGASVDTSSLDADGESMMRDGETEDSEVNDVSQRIGVMKVDNGKAMFVSEAHWYSVLSDVCAARTKGRLEADMNWQISEVKNYFATHREQLQEQYKRVEASKVDDAPGASFLFRAPRLNDRMEALANLPSKPVVDRLVAR